jgi:hypothetical protein
MEDRRTLIEEGAIVPKESGSGSTLLQHTEGKKSDFISTSRVPADERMRSGTTADKKTGQKKEFYNPGAGRVQINLFFMSSGQIFDLSTRAAQEHWNIASDAPGGAQAQAMKDTIRTMEVLIKGKIPAKAVVKWIDPPTKPPREDVAPWP